MRLKIIDKLLEKEPKFRKEQVLHAIFNTLATSFSAITTLPKSIKEILIEAFGDEILTLKMVNELKALQASKYLFELRDNHRIESARLSYQNGRIPLCISTQVGCAVGCSFCETGKIGFKRQLTADEIVDQVLYFKKINLPVETIVFMGMGEPLLNPNLFDAIVMIINQLGFGQRRLSISTVGIPKQIELLSKNFPQIGLTLSLHSPFNNERDELIPLNCRYNLEELFSALEDHILVTNKKTFLAYIIFSGKNDSKENAKMINSWISRKNLKRLYHLNLLFYNGKDEELVTKKESLDRFKSYLDQYSISYTVRPVIGKEIEAACGQLVANYLQ